MKRFTLSGNQQQNLTPQQQKVVDSLDPTVLVNAVAGSGKTATLMHLATKYKKGIYLAFNKAIVKDVVPKLPMGWTCKTFNAFGLGMIKKHYPHATVNFNKYFDLPGANFNSATLVSKHMNMNGNVSDVSWKETCNRFKISPSLISESKEMFDTGKANTNVISGDDMLQYPIDNGWKSEEYEIVLVDECQDLNPQQIAFLTCIPTKRIVFVGDMNQAIYGFRGSDPYAIQNIDDHYNPVEYELTESFRCPQEIINTIKHIVPNITSKKTGGEIDIAQSSRDIDFPDECFIISRTNNNLVKLAYKFILNNDHFSIGGAFIAQLKKDLNRAFKGANSLADIKENVIELYEREIKQTKRHNWNIASVENKYDSLLSIINVAKSIEDIHVFVKNLAMHSDSASCRKLMTIHAAKGLESPTVYFIKPDACAYFKEKTDIQWEKQQEDNLYYVACTRALNKLVFVN
jgi:superfamily I DNA/RNA helicase|tara:strand:+ start:1065 stop:2444 length:1380 start_codon:yes stop_codon:yes gene_type:complete